MKKIIIIIFIISSLFLFKNGEKVIIPTEAIRYRIISNSNNEQDVKLKWQINEALIPYLMDINKNSTSIESTREAINKSIPDLEKMLNKYNVEYNISYGNNYFPKKEYDEIKYPEGEYESLVISLGEAKGSNWWCVMFPPLCLLEAKYDNTKNIKYKSYIIDRIKKEI